MRTMALIMAGGSGTRIRRSGIDAPKPLVPIRGLAMLERNILALACRGFGEIAVSTAGGGEVARYVRDQGCVVARAAGAELIQLEESRPLGTIGAAGLLADRATQLLVVNADILTSLDPRSLLAFHREAGAALTLATHREPFRLSFGELSIEAGRVTAYTEKPLHHVTVCSAISALGAEALQAIHGPTQLDELAQGLIDGGCQVAAYPHDEPWIDVNDAAGLARAEELVAAQPRAFECWCDAPDREVVDLLLTSSLGAERDALGQPHQARIPRGGLPLRSARALARGLGAEQRAPEPLVVFDAVDPAHAGVTRHHCFTLGVDSSAGQRWLPAVELAACAPAGSAMQRALAWLAASLVG